MLQDAAGREDLRAGSHTAAGGDLEFLAEANWLHSTSGRWFVDGEGLPGVVGVPHLPEHSIRAPREHPFPHP